jgi:hypothetical protein
VQTSGRADEPTINRAELRFKLRIFLFASNHQRWLASIQATTCVCPLALALQANRLSEQKLIFESSEAVSVISTFDDLGLKEDLLRGIYAYSAHSLTLHV